MQVTREPGFAGRGAGEAPVGVAALPGDVSHPGTASPLLVELMAMDEAAWESFSRGSPVRRAGRAGLLRNVAVAIGNWGSEEAVPVLVRALEDPEALVRGHAAWALGRVASGEVRRALEERLEVECDPLVREEIALVLKI